MVPYHSTINAPNNTLPPLSPWQPCWCSSMSMPIILNCHRSSHSYPTLHLHCYITNYSPCFHFCSCSILPILCYLNSLLTCCFISTVHCFWLSFLCLSSICVILMRFHHVGPSIPSILLFIWTSRLYIFLSSVCGVWFVSIRCYVTDCQNGGILVFIHYYVVHSQYLLYCFIMYQ